MCTKTKRMIFLSFSSPKTHIYISCIVIDGNDVQWFCTALNIIYDFTVCLEIPITFLVVTKY